MESNELKLSPFWLEPLIWKPMGTSEPLFDGSTCTDKSMFDALMNYNTQDIDYIEVTDNPKLIENGK